MNEEKNNDENHPVDNGESLLEAIDTGNDKLIMEIAENSSSQEVLRQASLMDEDKRIKMVSSLSLESAVDYIENTHPEVVAPIFEGIDSSQAAKIIEQIPLRTQTEILQMLDSESSEAIISEMDSDSAEDLRWISQYDSDSAGGLMELDTFSFQEDDTVGDIISRLVKDDDAFERHQKQHPYILDDTGKLLGVVSLRNLLRSKRSVKLSEIMLSPAVSVTADASQNDLAIAFSNNPFLGIPVTDSNEKLLGVVSRMAIEDAISKQAEIDALHRNRTGDELRSMPLFLRTRRRLSWLSSNIVLNIIAASVISQYEETLTAMIAIAVFLPMVSDMSGCSGNQAVGVSMRELSLGLTRPSDLFHVLKKEMGVGVINGIVLGFLIGMVAWVWKGNAYLGLVIGLALSLNTLLAVSIGGTIPLLLKKFGIDPAVASGPLLTTVTDMAGFFLVLSLATFFMPQLLG